jgi:hypothetical protein
MCEYGACQMTSVDYSPPFVGYSVASIEWPVFLAP